jgi:hypothetical protein
MDIKQFLMQQLSATTAMQQTSTTIEYDNRAQQLTQQTL